MWFDLSPGIKNYNWGTPGVLSKFLGLQDSSLLEAEAWFGRHPQSDTIIHDGEKSLSFLDWLEAKDSSFDLLLKLLSASRPLSIQVHPNEPEAQRGYLLEQSRGSMTDSQEITFTDPRPKPELIVALSPDFRALYGFVSWERLVARLEALVQHGALPSFALDVTRQSAQLRDFLEWVLLNGQSVSEATGVLAEAIDSGTLMPNATELGINTDTLERVHRGHPGDSGLLLTLAMHHLSLKEGEGLFVAPGTAHAYVKGFGLEVMVPSDNVVRAGLTTKPRHPEAFLEMTRLDAFHEPEIVLPEKLGDVFLYSCSGMPFELRRLGGQPAREILARDSLIVVESGHITVGAGHRKTLVRSGGVGFAEAFDVVTAGDQFTRAWLATNLME